MHKAKRTSNYASRCCQTGCEDCPYDHAQKVDPEIPPELQIPWKKDSEYIEDEESLEIYEGDIPDSLNS